MKKIIYIAAALMITAGCMSSRIEVPVVQDKGGYTMFGQRPERVFAAEAGTEGKPVLKWENDINGSFNGQSVAVYDRYLFVNDLSGRVYCMNMETGKILGQLKHKGAVYTTPIIHDFRLIFAGVNYDENSSTVIYYDYRQGKMLHEAEIKGRIMSEPVKTEEGLVLVSEDGRVYKFDIYGGKLWEKRLENYTHTSPAYGGGKIIIGDDKGVITVLDAKNGEKIYSIQGEALISGSPAVSGDIFAVGDEAGKITAYRLKDGEMVWEFETGARTLMTPVFYGEKMLIGNLRGDLYMTEGGKEIWKKETGGVLMATPFIAGGRAFVPDLNGRLFITDAGTGEIQDTIVTEGRMKLSPVYAKGKLFTGHDRGVVSAWEFEKF